MEKKENTHQETTDWVRNNLNGESAEVLMPFVDYLYGNGFTFDGEGFHYLGHDVGIIHIYAKDDWWIYLANDVIEHERIPYDGETAAFMQSQAKLNMWCGGACANCKTPEHFVLFGKEIDNICKNVRVAFGYFNIERVTAIDPERCFTAERMEKALRVMDRCKRIVEYKKIEDSLKASLGGDLLKNALDFAVYLTELGMVPDPIQETTIRFNYEGQLTCILVFFKVDDNPDGLWVVCDCPIREDEGFPLSAELVEFVRSYVKVCNGECGCPDWPRGGDKTIFGREYKSVCSSEIHFLNPDADAVEKIKVFMEFWKYLIDNQKSTGR
jgi:hypothetical protein